MTAGSLTAAGSITVQTTGCFSSYGGALSLWSLSLSKCRNDAYKLQALFPYMPQNHRFAKAESPILFASTVLIRFF